MNIIFVINKFFWRLTSQCNALYERRFKFTSQYNLMIITIFNIPDIVLQKQKQIFIKVEFRRLK